MTVTVTIEKNGHHSAFQKQNEKTLVRPAASRNTDARKPSLIRMGWLAMIISLLGVLSVIVSDARPIVKSLYTACLADLSNRTDSVDSGRDDEEGSTITSEITTLVMDSFILGIHYLWHRETQEELEQLEKTLYRIENKIDKLSSLYSSYSSQREQEEYIDNFDYENEYMNELY